MLGGLHCPHGSKARGPVLLSSSNSTPPVHCAAARAVRPQATAVRGATICLAATVEQEAARSLSPDNHPQDEDRQERLSPSPAAPLQQQQPGAAREAARQAVSVLRALCQYAPMELSDGPASLSKVRPYSAPEVQAALQHAMQQQLLSTLDLQQLSNLTGALAAAGHLDRPFMEQLGQAAAAQLKAQPRLLQHTPALRAFRSLCWLAVGFSRLGVMHPGLMEQVAVYATHLLQRCPLQFSKRKHGQQLALLVAAFAALKLYPPQLFRAVCEHLKQHRQVIRLLGPKDSMLLLWGLTRVGHSDPPALLWITQRAATQVGQLTCGGLAHAYSQCAAVGITSAPLLAALRKACRVKLASMQPADLAALLAALAALGQQDLLYLDEISRAVHNKLANFTAAEVTASLAALAALRYRNPWLLDQASRMMVSHKLRKSYQLTPEQLAGVLASCHQLAYTNPLLLGHLGTVATEVQLVSCSPAQLEGVVAGYQRLGFHQPQLLQAAATRLLQLSIGLPAAAGAGSLQQQEAAAHNGGEDHSRQPGQQALQQEWQELGHLVRAGLHLALMPPAGGSSAEKAVLPAALLGLTVQVLATCTQQQQQHHNSPLLVPSAAADTVAVGGSSSRLQVLVLLLMALLLCVSMHRAVGPAAPKTAAATGPGNSSDQQHSSEAAAGAGAPAAAAGVANASNSNSSQQQAASQLSEVVGQLAALQPRVQQEVQQLLAAAVVRTEQAAAVQALSACSGLLSCMQMLWLIGQAPPAAADGLSSTVKQQQQQQQAAELGHGWRLGLPETLADALMQHHREQMVQQQQAERQGGSRPLAHVAASAVTRVLQGAAVGPQQQQQQQQQQQGARHVRVMYPIPGSPILLPVAVLPAGAAEAAVVTGDTRLPAAAEGAGSGVFLCVPAELQRRKVRLPAEAQELVTAAQRHQRPVAVFVESEQLAAAADAESVSDAGMLAAWHTLNAPQQPLPAARLWRQGLCAAGWDVLVL